MRPMGRGRLGLLVGTALAALALATALAAPAQTSETGVVDRVVDGDTLVLVGGARVRLVQIDAPEVGSGECYSRAATRALARLAPPGERVRLEADPALDRVDRYGRLLRYVFAGPTNVNLALVARGDATVWFYRGERGRYAARLLAAASTARARRLGLWGACRAVWDPEAPAQTGPGSAAAARGGCDPSYPDVCIPPPPPDLDCGDIPFRSFRVLPPDPHRFDGDHDGVGCER